MGIWALLFGKGGYKREGAMTLLDRQTVQTGWQKVEEQASLGKPSNLKSAVIEADKLVDFALRKMYPAAETMGERLKEVKPKFIGNYALYDDLWFAHKLRNELVHNVGFEIPTVEARPTLEKFKAALVHLGVV